MTAHTLSPWTVRLAHEGYEIESSIGSVTTAAGMSFGDAVLVAAAPDLLYALEYCRDLLEGVEFDYRPDDEAASRWADVKAVISRARGVES